MSRRTIAVVGVAAVALALAGSAPARQGVETKLFAQVGPEATITLRDGQGNRVTQLGPGAYEIEVKDLSDEHNFHLTGPGVNQMTEVSFVGETTWHVTLQDGNYRYVCDPHSSSMRGTFTVGTPPPTTTPPPVTMSAPVGARLLLTVGPTAAISLKTSAGKAVKVLRAGSYTFLVRDRSTAHNARLLGAGVNRATGVAFTGARTWKLTVRKGTLVFRCDPHRTTMRGAVQIVA
jgi:plastocyanin